MASGVRVRGRQSCPSAPGRLCQSSAVCENINPQHSKHPYSCRAETEMLGQARGLPFPPTLVSGGEPVPPRGAGGADGGGQGAWHLSLPRPPSLWSRGGPGRGVLIPAAGQAWEGLSTDPMDGERSPTALSSPGAERQDAQTRPEPPARSSQAAHGRPEAFGHCWKVAGRRGEDSAPVTWP